MPEETAASSSAASMDEKPCSSNAAAAAADGLEDVLEEAKKLIGTGNRHMVMGDVVSAVGVFQEACGMLAEKYGDTADECGEAFFLCGKALLELARMENTVLGNALDGVPEESSEEGEKQNDSKIESADNLDDEDDDDEEDDDEDGEGNAEDKESEDEVGNLQLAWEMLEVAKVIYTRKEGKEDQLMMAQIFLKLGEVGTESGNYGQAVDDFQECLALQLKHLPPHSRLLAETHYQLGITFSFTNEFRQAIDHFNSSIKVIETRVAMLQEVIDKAEAEEEAVKENQTELEELKQLLPEIKEKVEDAKESQRTAAAASVAIQQTMGGASTSSAFPAENGGASSSSSTVINQIPVKPAVPSKSASDISHLVRKKRKPEEESPKQDSEAKKVKQETTVNGSGDSASNGNGVQEKMEQEASA